MWKWKRFGGNQMDKFLISVKEERNRKTTVRAHKFKCVLKHNVPKIASNQTWMSYEHTLKFIMKKKEGIGDKGGS